MVDAVHKTGGEFLFSILGQFLVDLHLILGVDHFVMWLIQGFARTCGDEIEELGFQRFLVGTNNDTCIIGTARAPNGVACRVADTHLKKGTAKADAGGQPVSGFVGDANLCDQGLPLAFYV